MAKRVIMSAEIEAQRKERLDADHPCYDGQWKVHGPHSYELRVQAWLGGGTAFVYCPGVKLGQTIQERYAR